jgi:hypothetical protein
VIDALAAYLDEHRDQMIELRETARVSVGDIDVASDLRLLDIVIWCSQDDLQERPGKKRNAWLDAPHRAYEPDPVTSIPVTAGEGEIIDVPDSLVDRYLKAGYCQTDLKGEMRPAHQPSY